MEFILPAKVFAIHSSLAIVIPNQIVKALKLKTGDTLVVSLQNNAIVLERVKERRHT